MEKGPAHHGPDDTSSILWRRRCYERVIERSTWNLLLRDSRLQQRALPSKSVAQQITSAAAHIELILFLLRCDHHAIESAA
jgi:hypothetical protein